MIGRPIKSYFDLPPMLFRQEDVDECAAGGLSIDQAVSGSIAASDETFLIMHQDRVLGVWGYRRDKLFHNCADVWLLTTPNVELFPIAFVRESRRLRDILNEEFEVIRGQVHGDYSMAVNWLTRLGFTPVVADSFGFFTVVRSA